MMALFVFLLLLSALNVGLGYALAVWLGYGPRRLQDAWIALGVEAKLPGPSTALSDSFLATPDATGPKPLAAAGSRSSAPAGSSFDPPAEYGGGAT